MQAGLSVPQSLRRLNIKYNATPSIHGEQRTDGTPGGCDR